MKLLVWNAAWASPRATKGRAIADLIADHEPDLVVLTEGERALLPPDGHVIEAAPDWGYRPQRPELRKVLLWSHNPWFDVYPLGEPELPTGRWVAGSTVIDATPIRLCGVCIPWAAAHVSTGRRDRVRWEDHTTYLRRLGGLLDAQSRPLIVAGDLNQRIPRQGQPTAMFELLQSALEGLEVPTAGEVDGIRLIDHIAHSPDLATTALATIDRHQMGVELTDHTGVVAELDERAPRPGARPMGRDARGGVRDGR